MDEQERLSIRQKADLAGKYKELNELLQKKRTVDLEIGQLAERLNSLRQQADKLDYEFHQLAIKVEPTEVIPSKPSQQKRVKSPIVEKINEKLRENPELLDNPELQRLLSRLI